MMLEQSPSRYLKRRGAAAYLKTNVGSALGSNPVGQQACHAARCFTRKARMKDGRLSAATNRALSR
jgi:hypothetical protein